jgi:5-epi-alpha-selinene synthase
MKKVAKSMSERRPVRTRTTETPRRSMVVPRPTDEPRTGTRRAIPKNSKRLGDPGHAPKPSAAERRTGALELYCPFDSGLNPYVEEVQSGSVDWAHRFGMIKEEHRAKLHQSKIAWLTARGFPEADRDALQLAADWTTLFCLLDDRIEVREADPVGLSAYFLQLLTAFESGHPGSERDPICEGLADLQKRMARRASPTIVKRFSQVFRELLGGFLWEEVNRWKLARPNRDAYGTMRQITVGLRPQFVLGEIAAGIELTPEVRTHGDIATLESLTCHAIGWANDIFTCAKEFGQDHAHNIVLLVMDEETSPLASVARRIADGHDELIRTFESTEQGLPKRLAHDKDVQAYVSMLRYWIRGHLDWAVETGRYVKST